jgi:hypothetical protein
MRLFDKIEVKTNVEIIARERGKRVPSLCRKTHNTWVNIGRQYLAEVISPGDPAFSSHYNDSPVRVVQYMGLGIGGSKQLVNIATLFPALDEDYPGQNTYTDEDIAINWLERPVKVTGTPGKDLAPGVWMRQIAYAPNPDPELALPKFSGTPIISPQIHKVEYVGYFTEPDINLAGGYDLVPLSECALMLSIEQPSRLSNEVYDYGVDPTHVGPDRQLLVAYNAFATISKTMAVSLELHWELSF